MDFSAITSAGTFTVAAAALAAVEGSLAVMYVAWVGGRMVFEAINGYDCEPTADRDDYHEKDDCE